MNSTNAHIIAKSLFKSELKRRDEMFNKIHLNQLSLTGSPNFIYKGGVQLFSKKAPVKVLDKSLIPSMKEALNYQEELISDISFVARYIATHSSNNTSELYNILPPCTHSILDKYLIREPAEIKPVKHSNYDILADILQKRHLEKLL